MRGMRVSTNVHSVKTASPLHKNLGAPRQPHCQQHFDLWITLITMHLFVLQQT